MLKRNGKEYDLMHRNGKWYDLMHRNGKWYGKNYVSFKNPILDLDFQNNFTDKSLSALNMVQGQGLPTFGLSGRKAGEYCVNFNGSQSIKTTTNLPLNSDKVTVAFWMKTTQTGVGMVTEMSPNFNSYNSFGIFLNNSAQNKIDLGDRASNYNIGNSVASVNTGIWIHAVMTIDRLQNGTSQNKIYVNGVLSYVQHGMYATDNNSNFVNNILYIGQRAGTSVGYVGSLMKFQIFNGVPTDAQAMEMYLNDL